MYLCHKANRVALLKISEPLTPPGCRATSSVPAPRFSLALERPQPSRIGSRTPIPSRKSHSAGAGVPSGRVRRFSLATCRGSSSSRREYLRYSKRNVNAVGAPHARCPISGGKSAVAAFGRPSASPVFKSGGRVRGRSYHQIRPNTQPQEIPRPKLRPSCRNGRP